MNVQTSLKDFDLSEEKVKYFVRRYERIRDFVDSNFILMSNGKLKKGYNPNLITKKGKFSLSSDDSRFYFEGDDFYSAIPYDFMLGELYLGYTMLNALTYEQATVLSIYNHMPSLLTADALIKKEKGVNLNVNEKCDFLEEVITKNDKNLAVYPLPEYGYSKLKALKKLYEEEASLYLSDYSEYIMNPQEKGPVYSKNFEVKKKGKVMSFFNSLFK